MLKVMMRALVAGCVCLIALFASGETAEWTWIDGTRLPIEGKAFADTERYYDRLPACWSNDYTKSVWSLQRCSAGLAFRFVTDAEKLRVRWSLTDANLAMAHMPATGVSGVDVYQYGTNPSPEAKDAKPGWQFCKPPFPSSLPRGQFSNEFEVAVRPGQVTMIYLPTYNGVSEFALGLPKGKSVKAAPVRASGVVKPVVFYGTSTTQGGCTSRPSAAWPSIVGMEADVPIVNLGFSGSGQMEGIMVDVLARIDASLYVLDTIGNVNVKLIGERYEKFVRRLREKRPGVPIIVTVNTWCDEWHDRNEAIRAVCRKIKASDPLLWKDLTLAGESDTFVPDRNYAVEGVHLNDWGAWNVGRGFAKAVSAALVERAEVPRHVFSMSFKVTSLNGELTRPGMKERAAAWMKSHHISKVWLETYRHAEYVPTERLVAYRDWFRTNGFEVCGLLTPTMLNDPATSGEKPAYCCCWSDPKCRRRLADEAVRSTGIFDTVLLDDFLFDTCSCPRCTKLVEDSGKSREAFRFDHMTDLCRQAIYEPAHAKNPGSRFIVKFQCWFEQWPRTGLDPKRLTDVFGACWIGTESRDNCKDPLQSATITPWVNGLTGGRCEGCWFDPLDSTPERYVQQARYTVLGGTRETLFHAYDYLIAEEPGAVPFGQSPKGGHACLAALDAEIGGLWQLAETVGTLDPVEQRLGPDGVSRHIFRKGDTIYTAFQNTTDAARSVGCPKGAHVVLALPDASAFDAARGVLKAHGFVLFADEGGSATARADRPWVSGRALGRRP